jgi:hypothetical protein
MNKILSSTVSNFMIEIVFAQRTTFQGTFQYLYCIFEGNMKRDTVLYLFDIFSLSHCYQSLSMGKEPVDLTVCAQVVARHGPGLSQIPILQQLKVLRCCVQNVIKKCKQLDRYDNRKYTECQKNLSSREFRHLKKLVRGDSPALALRT